MRIEIRAWGFNCDVKVKVTLVVDYTGASLEKKVVK